MKLYGYLSYFDYCSANSIPVYYRTRSCIRFYTVCSLCFQIIHSIRLYILCLAIAQLVEVERVSENVSKQERVRFFSAMFY